eukprot:scaffold27336_cov63-Phaeocystis_antarctica.AAC.7
MAAKRTAVVARVAQMHEQQRQQAEERRVLLVQQRRTESERKQRMAEERAVALMPRRQVEAARAEGVRRERERALHEAEEARLEARRRDAARDLLIARRHAERAQGLRLQDAASALRASLSSERCARGERRRETRALELREINVARVASAQAPLYGSCNVAESGWWCGDVCTPTRRRGSGAPCSRAEPPPSP